MATLDSSRLLHCGTGETGTIATTTTTTRASERQSDEQRMRYFEAVYGGAIPDRSVRRLRGHLGSHSPTAVSLSHDAVKVPVPSGQTIVTRTVPGTDRLAALGQQQAIESARQAVHLHHMTEARQQSAKRSIQMESGELTPWGR